MRGALARRRGDPLPTPRRPQNVSYLPDLEAYLADLLRTRERLLASVDVDEWAKAEAMPSEEEIRRVRTLIARVKTDLDQLSAPDHAQIQQAVTTVRRARNGVVGLGLPRTRPPLPNIRPERLEQRIVELTTELDERTQELDAARATNRELMTHLNTTSKR